MVTCSALWLLGIAVMTRTPASGDHIACALTIHILRYITQSCTARGNLVTLSIARARMSVMSTGNRGPQPWYGEDRDDKNVTRYVSEANVPRRRMKRRNTWLGFGRERRELSLIHI